MCLVQLLCLQLMPNTVSELPALFGSEKDKLRTSTTVFVKQKKIGLAIDCSFTFSSAGKDIWQKHLCKDLAVLCKQHGVEMRVWLPTHLKVM